MNFLIDNILYVAVAVVSGTMLIWPLLRRNAGCPVISPLDATMRINKQDATIIDVRSAEQYAQGHLLRARNLPLKEIADRISEIERLKGKPVIVTCDSGSGGPSTSAAKVLKQHGFTDVSILEGGITGWRKADLPVEK
ncbi:MAG TPA: rhodanese-like domain-containing protein [Burkholderiales bacterium]|jgi:Rhodanese-related sulfurtransferase